MNNFAINNIANMERALYGYNSGRNLNCPSMYNGYMGALNMNSYNPYMMNYYNPAFRGYRNYNQDVFTQANDATRVSNPVTEGRKTNSELDWNNPKYQTNLPFQGITQEDMNNLADYYAKNNALEEGFTGAAMGGLSWMAFEHAQSIFHPKNAWKGIKEAKEIFKNVPKEWAGKNASLLQEAQIAVQQAVRDTGKKGWWSQWLRRPLDRTAINPLLEEMKSAVGSGNIDRIAKATERLQAARGMDGRITGALTGRKTVAERLASKATSVESKAKELVGMNSSVISNNFGSLAKSFLKKDFLGFMAFETIFNIGKITTAFQKDTKTGVEQTCQSVGKSALGTAGWCLGRAGGALIGAKVGASLGIAGGPLGAGIGALIGFTVGSIGMWAGHKLGNWIFGHDVADKVEAQNLAQTKEGQAQLLQFAMQKAQEGKTDARTNNIVYKALNSLNASA